MLRMYCVYVRDDESICTSARRTCRRRRRRHQQRSEATNTTGKCVGSAMDVDEVRRYGLKTYPLQIIRNEIRYFLVPKSSSILLRTAHTFNYIFPLSPASHDAGLLTSAEGCVLTAMRSSGKCNVLFPPPPHPSLPLRIIICGLRISASMSACARACACAFIHESASTFSVSGPAAASVATPMI